MPDTVLGTLKIYVLQLLQPPRAGWEIVFIGWTAEPDHWFWVRWQLTFILYSSCARPCSTHLNVLLYLTLSSTLQQSPVILTDEESAVGTEGLTTLSRVIQLVCDTTRLDSGRSDSKAYRLTHKVMRQSNDSGTSSILKLIAAVLS